MKCQGCVQHRYEKLSAVKGVDKVQVDLKTNRSHIEGNHGSGPQTCPQRY